jgi:hypothetical protein
MLSQDKPANPSWDFAPFSSTGTLPLVPVDGITPTIAAGDERGSFEHLPYSAAGADPRFVDSNPETKNLSITNRKWFRLPTRDSPMEAEQPLAPPSNVAPQPQDHCFFIYGSWKCASEKCTNHDENAVVPQRDG